MKKIFVMHENQPWFEPLEKAFKAKGVEIGNWEVIEGVAPLQARPPEGVFFNRMSASSHTRDHRYAIEYAETLLGWLESHGRKVVNGRHTLTFETRKFDQYALLQAAGIKVPQTIAAVGEEALIKAAQDIGKEPFIVKPNRGGKGLGVQLYPSVSALEEAIKNGEIASAQSLDGVFLVQEYIAAKTPHVIRCEFIGGKFHYAVQVDTSGGFELCPADSCSIDQKDKAAPAPTNGEFCMADPSAAQKFVVMPDYTHANIAAYEAFLQEHKIDVAAIESIETEDGTRYTYDINVNTNYNKAAEEQGGVPLGAYDRLAEYLMEQLGEYEKKAA